MNSRRRIITLATCTIVFTVHFADRALAQPPAERFRESVFLDTDAAAAKKLSTLEEYLRAEQWNEAVQLAGQILDQHTEKLIAVGRGRYVDLHRRCQTLLATMSPAGLQTLRQQIDPRAEQWYQEGIANHDEASLRKIVKFAFLSSYGDDALAALAEMAFERGDYGDARGYWEMALPIEPPPPPGEPLPILTYPDTDLDRAELRARLVLCSLFQGDRPRFERELAAFTRRHGETQGTLAGRTGRLSEIIAAVAAEARQWPPVATAQGYPTFAGNAQRNLVLPQAIDEIGAVQWWKPLKPPVPEPLPRRVRLAKPTYLSHFPVVEGDTIFVNDDATISAYDLTTGHPAWGDPETDDAVIFRAFPAFDRHRTTNQLLAGVPRYTMTIAQGRLYARMGSPITGRGKVDALTRSESQLVCLDIQDQQGKVVWTIDAGSIGGAKEHWEFEGSPIVTGGKVYVALRSSAAQPQANVACFDAENGHLLWNRKVCTFLAQHGDRVEEMSHQLLTLGEGLLFYATNQGAIAAIDIHDGSLQWVVTYERGEQRPWTTQLKNGLAPCLYHQGTVIAAPADLRQIAVPGGDARLLWRMPTHGTVMAIDAKTGRQKWSKVIRGGVRDLLGVQGNRLIVSGDFLWALDIDTGRELWTRGHDDGESYGFGRGILAGNAVLWPKREAIWVFDIETGRPQSTIPLRQWRSDNDLPLSGGNLLIAGDMLLVAQKDALVAYARWGRLRQKLKEELSARPEDLSLYLQLGRAERATGEWSAAIAAYRHVYESVDEDDPDSRDLRKTAADKLLDVLHAAGRHAARDGAAEQAAAHYEAALQLPAPPKTRLQLTRELADIYRDQQRPQKAVDLLQTVLNDESLSVLPQTDAAGTTRTAAQVAIGEIDTLLAAHGREVYATVEEQAAAAYEAALAENRFSDRRLLAARYPQAMATAQAALATADQFVVDGEFEEALRAYDRALDAAIPSVRRPALWGRAHVLEQMKLWRDARATWDILAEEFPNDIVPQSSPPVTFTKFVATLRQQPQYARQAEFGHAAAAKLPLTRKWSRPLETGQRSLIPQGTPPAVEMQSIIIRGDRLQCLDAQTGRVRWQSATADNLSWAAYAGPQLLLAGPGGVEGVSIVTGKRLWRFDSATPATSDFVPTSATIRTAASPHLMGKNGGALVGLVCGDELVCLNAVDGTVRWRFSPPSAVVLPQWFAAGDRCIVQTSPPDRMFVLDADSGEPIAKLNGSESSWPTRPRLWDDDFLTITFDQDARLTRHAWDGARRWRFDHNISQTNALPDLLAGGGQLALVEDGDTLIKIDPDNGHMLWRTGLGVTIIPRAADSMCIDAEGIYGENDGILRSYRTDDGELRWERHLGTDYRWRTVACEPFLIVHPLTNQQPGDFPLWFIDPATGEPVQKIQLGGHGSIGVHHADGVTLVSTDDRLYGLVAM